jgi:hypothetical protein
MIRMYEALPGKRKIVLFWRFAILVLILSNVAICAPDESYGVVSRIIDGSSFDIMIEKADHRIAYGTERIALADIMVPDLSSSEGIQARDLAAAVLLNKRVFLDINDKGNGRDSQGRLICVVYLGGYYGQPILSPCYNRIVVDSGLAAVNESRDNEFDPADWWTKTTRPKTGLNDSTEAFVNRIEGAAKDLLRPVQGEAGREIDRRSKDAVDWIFKQLPIQKQ